MARQEFAWLDYAPDASPVTPGVITDCSDIVPVVGGYRAAPVATDVGADALPATCVGAAALRKLDDSVRIFAGTATHLYEKSGTTWSDVSSATYTAGPDSKWRFAQYGDVAIAVDRNDATQYSESGAFADLSGAPKAAIVETVNNFVMLFDYNDGVDDFPDGWFCSALGDYTDWTPSVATQCANGRLLDAPGKIKAAKRMGKQIVAYKERAMWLGTYEGPSLIWRWDLIPGDVGCVSQEAVVEITYRGGPAHIFLGYEDVYLFDGSRPVSIGNGRVRQFIQDNMDSSQRYLTITAHDRIRGNVYFYFPNRICLIYNYLVDKWGRQDPAQVDVEASIEYLSDSLTWDDLGTNYSTWDDLPTDISYDSPFWSASQAVPSLFLSDHTLYSLTGIGIYGEFTTNYFGDNDLMILLRRARVSFTYKNLSPNETYSLCTNFYSNDVGTEFEQDSVVSMSSNKFDMLRTAHWHKLTFGIQGDFVSNGYSVDLEQDGEE